VKNRPLLLPLFGAALGLTGAVLALVWTPGAAFVAALGALVAAGAAVVQGRVAPTPASGTPGLAGARSAVRDGHAEPGNRVEMVTVNGGDPTAGTTAVPVGGSTSVRSGAALTDAETGLFSQEYFDVAIDARIAAARRHLRPVGVVMLEVVEGLRSGSAVPASPTRIAEAIQATLREADTACRRSDGRFALLLEDTPENGAIWTVERIRRYLSERDDSLTLWAGVACYPAHGFSSEVLLGLANDALDAAREWRQDRIEVAVGE
jgi:GGDEF domain-containing protein